jgi:GPI ethanolamine phosphate transferase 2/3 subunit F
MLIKIPT